MGDEKPELVSEETLRKLSDHALGQLGYTILDAPGRPDLVAICMKMAHAVLEEVGVVSVLNVPGGGKTMITLQRADADDPMDITVQLDKGPVLVRAKAPDAGN